MPTASCSTPAVDSPEPVSLSERVPTDAVGRLLRHRVFRASSLRVVALGMGVLASIVISRLGGAEVKGVTSMFAAASILAFMVVNVDLPQQVLRFGRETGDVDSIRAGLIRTWPWYGALAVAVVVVGVATQQPALIWLAAGTFAYLVSGQLGVACTGISGPAVTAVGGIIQQVGIVVATVSLLATGHLDTSWAPLVIIFSFLAPLPLYFRAARPRGPRPASSHRHPSIRALIGGGSRWQGVRLTQLLLLRLDTLWVFWVLGAQAAGVYSVGLATAALAGLIPAQVASNTTYEAMRSSVGSLRTHIRHAIIAGLGCALVLAAIGWPLLSLAYGSEFAGSYVVLLAAAPGVVAYGALQVLTNQMRIVGAASSVTIPSVIGVVFMALGLWFLTPVWGLIGSALASSLGAIAAVVAGYGMQRRLASESRVAAATEAA